jgi:hypothetical protein
MRSDPARTGFGLLGEAHRPTPAVGGRGETHPPARRRSILRPVSFVLLRGFYAGRGGEAWNMHPSDPCCPQKADWGDILTPVEDTVRRPYRLAEHGQRGPGRPLVDRSAEFDTHPRRQANRSFGRSLPSSVSSRAARCPQEGGERRPHGFSEQAETCPGRRESRRVSPGRGPRRPSS